MIAVGSATVHPLLLRVRLAALLLLFGWAPVRADEFVAFSLGVAKERVEQATSDDWRTLQPELFTLGGMTRVRGLVIDAQNHDLILVGLRDKSRPMLTLDDLAVALRARFMRNEWPLVSIDPTEDTKITNMQRVRYEGGIENSAFGLDMFDADLRLKRIDQGTLSSGNPAVKGTFDLRMSQMQRGEGASKSRIQARLWFYPTLSSVYIRNNIAAIDGLKVAVFTQVLSAEIDDKVVGDPALYTDPLCDEFTRQLSANYESVAAAHPSIARLPGLLELVALTHAVEQMQPRPDLAYWWEKYRVLPVVTPLQQEVLHNHWRGDDGEGLGSLSVEGGVHLTALATRLEAKDTAALSDAVLTLRPEGRPLSWTFVVGQWVLATTPGTVVADTAELFAQAQFLYDRHRYSDALVVYDRVVELNPAAGEAWNNRGLSHVENGQIDEAIGDYNRAFSVMPNSAAVLNNRSVAHSKQGQLDLAMADLSLALILEPKCAAALCNRGTVYDKMGQSDLAFADLDEAIALDPGNAVFYNNRGNAYFHKEKVDLAIADYSRAIQCSHGSDINAFINRGDAYLDKGMFDSAMGDFNQVIAQAPDSAEAFNERGAAYGEHGEFDRAIDDFDKAISLKPGYARAQQNREIALRNQEKARERSGKR